MEVLLKKSKSKSARNRSRSLLSQSTSSATQPYNDTLPQNSLDEPPQLNQSSQNQIPSSTNIIKRPKSPFLGSPPSDSITLSGSTSSVNDNGRKSLDFTRSRSKSRSRSGSVSLLFRRASEKLESPPLQHSSLQTGLGELHSNVSKSSNARSNLALIADSMEADSSKTEVLEYLESLKQASLQALNTLIHRIVEDETSNQQISDQISTSEMIQIPLQPQPFKPEPISYLSRSIGGSQIFDRAAQISDGGQIVAALNQTQFDRAPSFDILRRSSENLHPDDPKIPPALHDDLTSDHGLALALAALCNGLYQIIETTFTEHANLTDLLNAQQSIDRPVSGMFTQLVSTVTEVQSHRQILEDQIDAASRVLWTEIDSLMELVQRICRIRQQRANSPPPYHEAIRMDHIQRRVQQQDLNLALMDVVSSIDRVMNLAPRLINQTVILTARQEKIMSIATLTGVIDRLSRGRLMDQRAEKLDRLGLLVEQITKAGERRMMDQRFLMTRECEKKLDAAKMGKIIDRQEKLRMSNQDWESKEQQLLDDLNKLYTDLVRIQPSPSLSNDQRFILTPMKEKDLYISGVAGKIGKMAERRMDNQDAKNPREIRAEDIEKMMDRMRNVGEEFENQKSPMPARKREALPVL